MFQEDIMTEEEVVAEEEDTEEVVVTEVEMIITMEEEEACGETEETVTERDKVEEDILQDTKRSSKNQLQVFNLINSVLVLSYLKIFLKLTVVERNLAELIFQQIYSFRGGSCSSQTKVVTENNQRSS